MTTNSAFVFPGQGSQYVGMLGELATSYPLIQEVFFQASMRLGYDLWQLVQQGPEEKLNQTEHTQAAMLVADVALFKVLESLKKWSPNLMAGHSLGEYAALVCAKAISLADAAELVSKRGQLMQETVPLGEGSMAALIGLTNDEVDRLCQQVSDAKEQVSPANYNAIGQVVIAGHSQAIAKAVKLAEEMGARMAKIIPVSVPCHCSLLREAATAFADCLAKVNFATPTVAVIANVDLSIYKSPKQIRELLEKQLYSPVRWVETIQLMKERGVQTILECGPGKVLTGLNKRIDKELNALSIDGVQLKTQDQSQERGGK